MKNSILSYDNWTSKKSRLGFHKNAALVQIKSDKTKRLAQIDIEVLIKRNQIKTLEEEICALEKEQRKLMANEAVVTRRMYDYSEAVKVVQQLKIQSPNQYTLRYTEDPLLPSIPSAHYRDKGWKDWDHFLGTNTYETIAEAKAAVYRLGILYFDQYRKHRHEDPRLPQDPATYYKDKGWKGWRSFCANYYATLQEVKVAIDKLSIGSPKQYRQNYKKDLRLPVDLKAEYEDQGYVDFYHLMETNYYDTLAEAREAVLVLGIKTNPEYDKRFNEDPRLHRDPKVYYAKDWKGWTDFLGREGSGRPKRRESYETLEQAILATKVLDVSTAEQYKEHYKKDPLLPSCPNVIYAGKGWKNWFHFLGKE